MSEKLRCMKCDCELEDRKVRFGYLGHILDHPVPCCPKCGQVYVSEDLVVNKINEVEVTLEDK